MLNRRHVLLGGLALGAGAVTACSSPRPASAPPQPRKGGRLRAAFQTAGAKESLDPHTAVLFVDGARSKALYDKLTDFGPDMAVVPRLAREFTPNADATKWRFVLREATFHDGRPVTAEDVLASYARILDPKAAGRRAKAFLEPIDLANSRAIDQRTVEFALKRPTAEFPNATAAFGAWIVPKGAEDFTKPVGSGPFRFVSFTPGQPLVADRYDGYWDGPAYLDRIEFVPANEETARMNALLSGQAEYAHDLAATSARTYSADQRVRIVRSPGGAMHALAMKLDRPPFNHPDVRAAFRLIADRQQLVTAALSGMGEVGNDLFGKGYQHYASGITQRTQDLGKARALLKRAGAEGLTVKLDTAPAGAGLVEAAAVFAEHAKKAGVTVEVAVGNKDTFWADTLNSGSIASYRSGAMPIETHIASRLLTTSPQNVTKWGSPEFDTLYRTMQSTVDPQKRAALYTGMQQQLHDQCGLLVWGFGDWIVGTAAKVGGVGQAPPNTLEWARFDKAYVSA
ncbi:ABC transporter substrate-binding protein [Longispora albida]|uniref:ABC transporter substrate-binding protein n=1 Tax=Longispora albida TaxID=203523 RepID=UPI0003A46CAC|nr:ABC transporter substrate-binding protein [Longispora albida]